MTVLTERDLAAELQLLELRLHRGRRTAVFLTVLPAIVAFVLIGSAAAVVSRALNAARAHEARAAAAAQTYERRVAAANEEIAKKEAAVNALEAQAAKARHALDASRRASQAIAVNLFHRGEYNRAIKAYDEALKYDPQNAYVLNLKGYAQFKMKDLGSAEATLRQAVQVNPSYAWANFDLARIYCAKGDLRSAKTAAISALREGPHIRSEMAADGEFRRLCGPLLADLGID